MSVDDRMKDAWKAMQREAGRLSDPETPLKGGGGSGTFDGMEARVAKLESGVDELKKAVAEGRVEMAKGFGDVKATLAAIDERTKHYATKWEVAGIIFAILGAAGIVVALTARFLPI